MANFYTELAKPEGFQLSALMRLVYNACRDIPGCEHPIASHVATLENFKLEGDGYVPNPDLDTLVVWTSASIPADELTAFQALVDATPLESARYDKFAEIDRNTRTLFSLGFIHKDGVLHSLSDTAQRTYLGMQVASSRLVEEGLFMGDGFPIPSKDDNSATFLKGPDDLSAFFAALSGAVAYCKASGTAVKRVLLGITDIPTIQAFVDPRPLTPYDARSM